jgi:hypothetical protein
LVYSSLIRFATSTRILESDSNPAKKSHTVRNVIVVVALLAAAGFIFVAGYQSNCFGCSFPSNAIVSIQSVTCTGSANLSCTAELQNYGTASTKADGATITFGGQGWVGTCNQETLRVGSTNTFECDFQTGVGSPGTSFMYTTTLSNGYATFNGNFSG